MDVTNAAKEYFKTRGCRIKRTYSSRSEAKVAAKRMNRIANDGGRIRAYSCVYCELYHIGHIKLSNDDKRQEDRIRMMLKNSI